MGTRKALAVSNDGSVLVYEINNLVVAAEVGVSAPRRIYFSGVEVDAQGALYVAPALLGDLPKDALGARVTKQGVRFIRPL